MNAGVAKTQNNAAEGGGEKRIGGSLGLNLGVSVTNNPDKFVAMEVANYIYAQTLGSAIPFLDLHFASSRQSGNPNPIADVKLVDKFNINFVFSPVVLPKKIEYNRNIFDADTIIYKQMYDESPYYRPVWDPGIFNTFDVEIVTTGGFALLPDDSTKNAINLANEAIKTFKKGTQEQIKSNNGKQIFYDSGVIHENGQIKDRVKNKPSEWLVKSCPAGHMEKLRQSGVGKDRSKILGQYLSKDKPSSDGVYPGIGAILNFPSEIAVSDSKTKEVESFSKVCTSINMSKAIPFLNIEIVNSVDKTPEAESVLDIKKAFGLSMEDYLTGNTISQDSIPMGVSPIGLTIEDNKEKLKAVTSGMEVFTTPQTFANPDRDIESNNVTDNLKPYMSVIDFSVNHVGLGAGTAAHKMGTLKLKLHDRSKLRKVGALLSPDHYDRVRFRISYGYSLASDENESSLTKNEQFINRMRSQENFQVVNSSYTLNDSEIDITLNLASVGTNVIDERDVSPEGSTTYDTCIRYLKEASKLLLKGKSSGKSFYSEIRIPQILQGEGYQNFLNFSEEKSGELRKLASQLSSGDSNAKEAAQKIYEIFGKKKGKGKVSKAKASRAKLVEKLIRKSASKENPDPFLHKEYFKPGGTETGFDDGNYISLGHLIMKFIAPVIHKENGGTEVLFVFGCCNQNAGASFVENLASVPILKDHAVEILCGKQKRGKFKELDGLFSTSAKVTINSFISTITNKILASQNTVAYFGKNYKNLKNVQALEDALRKLYNNNKGDIDLNVQFSPIKLGVKIDSGPLGTGSFLHPTISDSKKIVRIIIFDQAHQNEITFQSLLESSDPDSGKFEVPFRDERNRAFSPKHTRLAQLQVKQLGFAVEAAEHLDSDGKPLPGKVSLKENIGKDIKAFIKRITPSLSYGTNSSCIIKAGLTLEPDASILSQRLVESPQAQRGDGADPIDLPLLVMPGSLSLEVFGCHYFHIGQKFFIDFGTDTTLDGFYYVISVGHSVANGKFTTNLSMAPSGTIPTYKSIRELATASKALKTQSS